MKLLAEPHASKVVRNLTQIVIKDDDDDSELPSNFTKRGMYERWCLDRGWVAKARGGMVHMEELISMRKERHK